ncbi:hypothetical protein PISMIDRAFT_10878 [Pisolithus microcarpus 441]|uniref:Uncharacterized protein n=1 Tax=Pisolithus microcarpus 441 TaxID=765257 RepID=A0A0C9YFE3_9AGAM|nr:hypothetical protein PISMIDRAFT_10878 [Pisolithus microcarpus 441]
MSRQFDRDLTDPVQTNEPRDYPSNDGTVFSPSHSLSHSPLPSDNPDARLPSLPPNRMDQAPRGESDACLPPPPPDRMDRAPPKIMYQCRVRPHINIQDLSRRIVLPKLQETMSFILALASATLDDPVTKLSPLALDRLRNPPCQPLRIDNPRHHHSISTYLATEHSSKDAYEKICQSTARNFPGVQGVNEILSYHNVENLIASLTRVEKIQHDMCPKSCTAFTGPYADHDQCLLCSASRWNQEVLQGTNGRSKARNFRHSTQILAELQRTGLISLVDDIAAGWDYLGAVLDSDIKKDNIVLMVSLDGAQLYKSKQSDCWIYIWIILNLAPDKWYKKVHICPGGFIPGPNKPKNVDSFLFVSLHHIMALQREGLRIWDSSKDCVFSSNLYLLFTTADGLCKEG